MEPLLVKEVLWINIKLFGRGELFKRKGVQRKKYCQ